MVPIAHDGSTVDIPSKKVAEFNVGIASITVPRFEGGWPISKEGRINATVNPQIELAIHSPFSTAGCSNIITPIPHYLPRIMDIEWILGTVAILMAFLDSGDKMKRKSDVFTSFVTETIDMNNYLPTSYDGMEEWRAVVGSVTTRARS